MPGSDLLGIFTKLKHTWQNDRLLQKVIRNSGMLFSSNTISMGLTTLQGLLAALLLDPADYGALGIIILFASSVNRLLSFRMGEVVIKFAGNHLALGEKLQATKVIKIAGLSEALTSILAYLLLILIAPTSASLFLKDPNASPLLIYYGLILLSNIVTETSTAVLQLANDYRSQAILNLVQSSVTAGWIVVAFFTHGNLITILNAYLAGKFINGIGLAMFAWSHLPELLGHGWLTTPFGLPSRWRNMARFAISTNLSSTINLVIRDSEVLWIGFFFTKVEAGYYKFALALMNIILMPISPFITTTFPEITASVSRREWKSLRAILKQTTLIAAAWTGICLGGVLVFGQWALGWFNEGAYLPSYPAILILIAGYGIANIFYWNRPLLLAFGLADYPLFATLLTGVIKTGLMFWLSPIYGFLAQAALLSGYFISSVGLIVRRGLVEISQQQKKPPL